MENKKVLIPIGILILVLAVLYAFSIKNSNNQDNEADNAQNDVAVQHVDLNSAEGEASLPQGFPSDIPVETDNAVESYIASYDNPPATQYSYSYESESSVSAKASEYQRFLSQNGYEVQDSASEDGFASFYAVKGNDDFSVSISASGEGSLVQISYLKRAD